MRVPPNGRGAGARDQAGWAPLCRPPLRSGDPLNVCTGSLARLLDREPAGENGT
jgi:hypothetical protein